MEQDKLLSYSNVRNRITSYLITPSFEPRSFRGLMLGMIMSLMMCEICVYNQITDSMKYGELPWYTADIFIGSISSLEALLAPFLSWMGYTRRRTMLVLSQAIPFMVIWVLIMIPGINTGQLSGTVPTYLCNGNPGLTPPVGATGSTIVRLCALFTVAVVTVMARIVCWSHGIAFLNEHKTDGMVCHYGILVMGRVVGLLILPKLITAEMATWMQVMGAAPPMVVALIRLIKVPQQAPTAVGIAPVPEDNRGFFTSLGRVVCNRLAMAQIFAMALLAAALWGFGWHEADIVKVKYYFYLPTKTWMTTYSEILRYHVVVLAILFMAVRYSSPLMSTFSRASATKLAAVLTLAVAPIYIVLVTVLSCQRGTVAGLAGNNFTQPQCSTSCGCSAPWNDFAPVCIVDQMTTYLTPCHAGCTVSDSLAGISVLSNCACGPSGGMRRATLGACFAGSSCTSALELHNLIYLVVVIFTVLSLAIQGVAVCRTVDSRDYSVAIGVSSTVLALVVFVCAHMAFFVVRAFTCSWFEGGKCQLQNTIFPYVVASISCFLALLSFGLSTASWLSLRGKKEPVLSTHSEIPLN